jgi:hydroxyacylglutathione hydrolase
VSTLTTGQWKQNAYILSKRNGSAVVIDPGEDAEQIVSYTQNHGLKVVGIVNTHAHYDHVGSVEDLRAAHSAKFYLHSGDAKLLTQANFYQRIFGGSRKIKIPPIDVDLAPSEVVRVGEFEFKILPTPGHTEGSVSLLIENMIFTGDLILFDKIGRSDLPGGNASKLAASVQSVLRLSDKIMLFPGHGKPVRLSHLKGKLSPENTL